MDAYDLVALGVLVITLLPIVHFDLTQTRIPNLANLALGLVGLGVHLIAAPDWRALALDAARIVGVFAVFAGTGWMVARWRPNARIGGGDIKFLMAAAPWVGFAGTFYVFALACGILLAVSVSQAAFAPATGDLWRPRPFGPMLCVALVLIFLLTRIN
ncbi:A24 family peptidase [Caulobacter segnis]|uniref:prepilin peptidase n=1 Tax=Caulobacter segnis TaxID=88688 RepID=UPI00240F1FD8|nr:A24 family peptidase [Caulobacter segnis]MDG2520736.1 A24 family peptidase [Caulobacter segnis]